MKTLIILIFTMLLILVFILGCQPQTKDFTNSTMEEKEFDYNTGNIQGIIKEINRTPDTSEKIKEVLDFVNLNIEYKDIDLYTCYGETASDVLARGYGNCVSMARLTVALLRGLDIPARTAGGCAFDKSTCKPAFALIPEEKARFPELPQDNRKKDYWNLHEWVEAYDGKRWVILEPYFGREGIFISNCNDYLYYGYDTNPIDRCVINDLTFVDRCFKQ